MILSLHPQEEPQAFCHLNMDKCTVHEEDKTKDALGRAKKSSLDVHGCNKQKPQIG